MKFLKYFVLLCNFMLCNCSTNLQEGTGLHIKYPTSKESIISLLTGDSTKLWICPKWHIAHSFSKNGLLYKTYIIKDDGTLELSMTPQEAIDTTIFNISNMNIQILLKGHGKGYHNIFWNQDSIKYISQDTLIIINPVREVLFINWNKYNATQKSK